MKNNDDKDIHKTALGRYQRIEDKERSQRDEALEDIRFAQTEGGQWDSDAREKRQGRPMYTINRVAGAIDQLNGDQRQNRTSIKIRPVSGGATEDVAKVMEGLIRNIETQSKALNAYDNAFDETANGGYGGWRVVTEFPDDDVFDQDVRIKQVLGATTALWFDPSAQEYDKRDANYAFYTTLMTKEEREDKYPDKSLSEWPTDINSLRLNSNSCNMWNTEDNYLVAEYWVKTPVNKEIVLLSDGRVIDATEDGAALNELAAQGITEVKRRKVKSHKVQMYVMDGGGILEGPKEWAGKFIPLIPMYGRQTYIEGQWFTRGLVRFAKDPARIYNYGTSTAIETTALTPKDPYWYTPAQVSGHEDKYRNFNTQNSPFMPYNPDPIAPGPPARTGAPSVNNALLAQIQQASMDLYHVTGMQPPSIGVNPELKSGKAIIAQEKQGDRGSFVFEDNKNKSVNYTAEILLDLVPRIYDTQRLEQLLAQDGETESVQINETVLDQETGEEVLVNDLSLGKYAVVTETGPAFATQRQESANQIIELISQSPLFEGIAMDLVAKDLPILESKELTKRVRKLYIQQGTVEPTEEEIKELGLDQPQQPDKQQEAITTNIEMQTEELMGKIEERDAKTLQITIDTQNSTIKAYKDLMDAYKVQRETGIPLTSDDRNIILKQQDIIEEAQQNIDEGPNREQAQSMVDEGLIQPQAEDSEGARRLTVEAPSASAGQDIVN
jgi:IS5 family transposase